MYHNNFDAIRILAASLVLYSHHFALMGMREPNFYRLHTFGGMAVMVFFVISGYLIAGSWYRDPHALRFFSKRVLRLWPALIVVVLLSVFVVGPLVTTLPFSEYISNKSTFSYLKNIFLQTHHLLPGVFETAPRSRSVNGSLWTIPFEVQCYILLGIAGIFGFLKNKKLAIILLLIALIAYLTKYNPDSINKVRFRYELFIFFFSGVALNITEDYWKNHYKIWLIFILITAFILWRFDFRNTAILCALPYIVIITGRLTAPYISRIGKWGDPSYGIYLYAFPIQQIIIFFWKNSLGFHGTLLLSFGITVFFAYLSWIYIEKPALTWKPKKKSYNFFTN